MLPIVKQTSAWHMDNPIGLIFLYVVYGLSFNIFVYVGYIKSLPRELEEAAVIDGASVWQTFWKIIFPLLSPINATVGIDTGIFSLTKSCKINHDLETIPSNQNTTRRAPHCRV